MKNRKLLLFSIIFVMVLFVIGYVMVNRSVKGYDIDKQRERIMKEYPELNLRTLDYVDVSMYFGIDLSEIPSSLFLTDFYEDEEHASFNPNCLVIVINSKNVDYYYDILQGYLDINRNNASDKDDILKFDEAIMEKDGNKMYLILGKNKKEIKKIILDN